MRRWIWIQGGSSVFSQAALDAAVARYGDTFTDFILAERLDTDSRSMFNSSLMTLYPIVIGGLTPGEYLIQQLHALDPPRRCHLWLYCGWWGTYSSCFSAPLAAWNTQSRADPDCRGTYDWLNWCYSSAPRQYVADICADFAEQNVGLDGIHLDYMRYDASCQDCGEYSAALVADAVDRIRAAVHAVSPGCEVTMAISGDQTHNEALTFRPVDLSITGRLIDAYQMMSYTSRTVAQKLVYITYLAGLANWEAGSLFPGLGTFDGLAAFETQLDDWTAAGYDHFSLFDSVTETDAMLALLPDIGAMTLADHLHYPRIEAQRSDFFTHAATMETAHGTPYLQCLYTPADDQCGLDAQTFDTTRKPGDEAEDWTEFAAPLPDAFSGALAQYRIDRYNGPLGHGYITDARVNWNQSIWRYRHHAGPETRAGIFDAWEETTI